MPVISSFSVHTHCNDLGGKVWNPAIKWIKKYAVFVVLESDDGQTGLGECWCFDTSPDALVAFLRTEVAPHILGCKIDRYPKIYAQLLNGATLTARHGILSSALSGVDIAIWDLQSRAANLPLWAYIHSEFNYPHIANGCVQLYGSGGLYGEQKSTSDLTQEMVKIKDAGFGIVKMKIGGLSIAEDIARVMAVLEAVEPSCQLIIDGVYSYTVNDALAIYNALPASRIVAFQSPVRASDIDGMRVLCEQGVPVMGTEAEYRDELQQALLDRGAVFYLQTAPVACGGITRLAKLSNKLSTQDGSPIKLSLEVSSTAVALAAACHFAAACDQVAHTEMHFLHRVFMDRFNLSAESDRPGWFRLSDNPGLGMSLPEGSTEWQFELSA